MGDAEPTLSHRSRRRYPGDRSRHAVHPLHACATPGSQRSVPGSVGSMRERRPGVWEIRIAVDRDAVACVPRQRSFTVHGTRADAESYRDLLLVEVLAARLPSARHLDLARLLVAWLEAEHAWKPSTRVGYRSVARFLSADPLGVERAVGITPRIVRATTTRWLTAGASLAVVDSRLRVLRACLSWAWTERILPLNPLAGMRGPGRPAPRKPLSDAEVGALLAAAEMRLVEAHANHRATATPIRLQRAEQDLLLVRLAADSGARRGELAALRFDDLEDRVLHIERGVSAGVLTTPKSGQARRLTLGARTAELWQQLHETWGQRWRETLSCPPVERLGPWLFAADLAHQRLPRPEVLGHRFNLIRADAGVPDATLHRLRHTVATTLVREGRILDAQARLGHADAATTLREYSHAIPGTDAHIADRIDAHLHQCRLFEP